MDLTHVSFFAGIGGFDLGLERAGWRTVAYSEIEPFAVKVFETHWPGVENLGDIVGLADTSRRDSGEQRGEEPQSRRGRQDAAPRSGYRRREGGRPDVHLAGHDTASRWTAATLWTGGFPCQDLSVAGKRRGLAGERSGLAFAFLALVERHRPPIVLLENVPGLLSSHQGRDLGLLLNTLADMGYMGAYRVLDARWFGVAQRRRRVFILAFDDDAFGGTGEQRAFEVLFEPEGGGRDPAQGGEAGAGAADRFADGIGGAGIVPQALSSKWVKGSAGPAGDEHHNLVVAAPLEASDGHHGRSSPRGDGADNLVVAGPPDDARGQAGRREGSAAVGGHEPEAGAGERTDPLRVLGPSPDARGVRASTGLPRRVDDPVAFHTSGYGGQVEREFVPTLQASDARLSNQVSGAIGVFTEAEDPLLPRGLDSARYRVLGNAVAVPVAEWIGRRLAENLA